MEFRDLKAQYANHKAVIDTAVLKAISSAHYIGGPDVTELELKLAEYVGANYCISCANGTDALQLALMAWGIGPGDAVFVPDFTFFSTGEVISTLGATPVFVDIDPLTFNMSSTSLKPAIEYIINNTDLVPRAIAPVDLFGLPSEFGEISDIAELYNLKILEDAAQGFGGRIGDRIACSFGDISTTSFFPAKPLGCYGDGGAIFTNDCEVAELLKSFKVHGKGSDKYDNIRIGMNSRLDTIQAAVLLEKLRFFDEEIEECNQVAKWYDESLGIIDGLRIPFIPSGYYSSWAQYTILLDSETTRERVMEELRENNIPSMIYYKKPMHLQGAFGEVCFGDVSYGLNANVPEELSCNNTIDICRRCLSLPMSAYVTHDDVNSIADVIRKVI